MRRIVVGVGSAWAALLLSGCGTICNFAAAVAPSPDDHVARPAVYGGVQLDAAVITGIQPDRTTKGSVFIGACLLVDVPLSLVGDTLTLPITLLLERCRAGSERDTRIISAALAEPEVPLQSHSTAMRDFGEPSP
jgi:uncharacterized protein YceK